MDIGKTIGLTLNILGGLGVFLYGLKLLSATLQKLSSEKLKIFFEFLTKNRLMGLLFGAIITSILQSSSATTVLMIGFANAGIIKLAQGISIIFGANIGTTITAQIMAIKASNIALPILGIGAMLYLFAKSKKWTSIGEVLVGLGLLFYGLKLMGKFLKPLKENPEFLDMMVQFGQTPLLGVLVGLLITVVIQSSSATTGMIIALASLGAIDFKSAFCLELGSNIGTTVTAQLAAIGANITAKRAAWAHTLFNVIGSAYMLILLSITKDGQPIFLWFMNNLTAGDVFAGENLPRHIANAHTFFNVCNAIVLFPFIGILSKATEIIIPGEIDDTHRDVKYIDPRMSNTPTLAISQAKKETHRMMEKTKQMNRQVYKTISRKKDKDIPIIKETEDTLDTLQAKIVFFLANLKSLSQDELNKSNALIHITEHLERIGDNNIEIINHYESLRELKEDIPQECIDDIKEMSSLNQDTFHKIIKALDTQDLKQLEKAKQIESKAYHMEETIRARHIKKVSQQKLSPKVETHFMKIIDHFDRIRDQLRKITKQIPTLIND